MLQLPNNLNNSARFICGMIHFPEPDNNHALFVQLLANDKILGSCQLQSFDTSNVTLCWLYVDPEYRRAGVGRALVEECISRAKAAGKDSVNLMVVKGNTPARSLYGQLAFRTYQTSEKHEYMVRFLDG